MAITRATNLAGLGTVFDALTDGGGLEITSGVSTFSDTHITGVATVAPVSIGNSGITLGSYTDEYGNVNYGIGIGTNSWSGIPANRTEPLYIRRSDGEGAGGILLESGLGGFGADGELTIRTYNTASNAQLQLSGQVGTANTTSLLLYAARTNDDGEKVGDSTGIVVGYNNPFYLNTGGQTRLKIDSSGVVGINSLTPKNKFEISFERCGIGVSNTAFNPFIDFKSNNVVNAAEIQVSESSGGAYFTLKTKNTSGEPGTRFIIDDNGNVGISTGTPSTTFTGSLTLNKALVLGKFTDGTLSGAGSTANGTLVYNESKNMISFYNGQWQSFSTGGYTIEVLAVAGGGGGGYTNGGGGGAGGVISNIVSVVSGGKYTVTVGAGGAGGTGSGSSGAYDGSESSFESAVVAVGGGAGSGVATGEDSDGGSGGGGKGEAGTLGGSGTDGQGNDGGDGVVSPRVSAGGGGAGAAGQDGGSGGNGGAGTSAYDAWGAATSSGEDVGGVRYFAGGGGGGTESVSRLATGGAGGGGDSANPGNGQAGTVNTGGGGGGGSRGSSGSGLYNGGNGGSGIVIIRYVEPQRGSGGTVTTNEGYIYHKFTSSGTYTA